MVKYSYTYTHTEKYKFIFMQANIGKIADVIVNIDVSHRELKFFKKNNKH